MHIIMKHGDRQIRGKRVVAVPLAESVLGRVINGQGQALNGRLSLQGKQPIYSIATTTD